MARAEAPLSPGGRARSTALGALLGAIPGALGAAMLVGGDPWAPADVAALGIHTTALPALLGAAAGWAWGRPVRGRAAAVGLLAVALASGALLLDGQPRPPARPAAAVGPEVARDGVSVLVIALDGAEASVLQPLIAAGEAPHLAALQAAGVSFPLRSLPVTASPVVWTTVATGRAPEDHGVGGFLSPALRFDSPLRPGPVVAPAPRLARALSLVPGASVEELPVSSLDRRTTALWEQASAAGRSVLTVGWWATWPAEPVLGVQVSDHVTYQRLNASASAREVAWGQVTPPSLLGEVAAAVVPPEEVEDPVLAAATGPGERPGAWVAHDPVSELRVALAAMQTHGAIAREELKRRPQLAMVYFQAIDIASHYFWRFGPGAGPGHAPPSPSEVARFGDVLRGTYRAQDRWVGELVAAFGEPGPDRAVVVLSDHGFGPAEAVQNRSPHVTGTHRRDGILIAAGGGLRPGAVEPGATVYDVAPTLLHLLGLPAGADMPGRVWTDLLDGPPPRRIPSWDGAPGSRPALPPSSAVDRDRIELLRSLGYLD